MDSVKIGEFIMNSRKELKLTQQDIANSLHVSNRSVSKWETGKSIPDASIMIELCDILKITVNELLCGKRLTTQEEIEFKKNTISMLSYKNKYVEFKIRCKYHPDINI